MTVPARPRSCRSYGTSRRWLEGQVRAGLLPASAGGQLEELARAVHDRRYELGPVTPYLRDPQVGNVDVNGRDQKLADSPTPAQALRALLRSQNHEPTIQIGIMAEQAYGSQMRVSCNHL